jgi:hypothetical protein
MWMLIAINAAMLAVLLVTLWRLHHLQRSLLIHNRPDIPVVRQDLDTLERRREQASARRSGLDEFPEEDDVESAAGIRHPQRRGRS